MANVTFIRGNTSKIDGTPVADGQLLFDTDKKTLQMDNGTTRENFAGAVASNVSVDNSTMKVVETNTVQSAIQDLDTNASNTSNIISDAWISRSYEVGEYAISDNKLWKCLVKNSVKPSESANWTEVSVGGEISQVNSNLSKLSNKGYIRNAKFLTSSSTVEKMTIMTENITISQDTALVKIDASGYGRTESSGMCLLSVVIDGTTRIELSGHNLSGYFEFMQGSVIKSLSKGTHSITLMVHSDLSSRRVVIPAYCYFSLSAVEI